VLDLVERALEDLLARGDATADFIQHFGGELNPSWDYTRGVNPLRADLFEAGRPGGLVWIDVPRMRAALAAGESIYVPGATPGATYREPR
jgi:hypothetical protein